MNTAFYRVRQFFRAWTAEVPEEERRRAVQALSPAARSLFSRQHRSDQRHALDVHHLLRQRGYTEPSLLEAALLHDVGKAAAKLKPRHRALIVLMGRLWPGLLDRLSAGDGDGWRRPYVVHAHHPKIGARWAEKVGCASLTVSLIRRHHERVTNGNSEEDRLLAALQAADSVS